MGKNKKKSAASSSPAASPTSSRTEAAAAADAEAATTTNQNSAPAASAGPAAATTTITPSPPTPSDPSGSTNTYHQSETDDEQQQQQQQDLTTPMQLARTLTNRSSEEESDRSKTPVRPDDHDGDSKNKFPAEVPSSAAAVYSSSKPDATTNQKSGNGAGHTHDEKKQQQQQEEESTANSTKISTKTSLEDSDDEDNPYLLGKDGNQIRRPLGTKKEIRELTKLSRAESDFSFADHLQPDADGCRPVTWDQLKRQVGYEKTAHKFKLTGTISERDQTNWDKCKRIRVRDEDKNEAALFFYDNNPESFQWDDLRVGNQITIRSPRYHRFMDGNEGMRVENCSTVVSVTQEKFSDAMRLDFGRNHKKNGNQKYDEKRYEDAIEQYDFAIKHLTGTFHEAPDNEAIAKELAASCFLNVAACFVAMKQFSNVEAPCRKALTINAGHYLNSKAYFRIGQSQFALGNYVPAVAALERSLQITPNEPRVMEELAKVREAQGEHREAQKALFRTKHEQHPHQHHHSKNMNLQQNRPAPLASASSAAAGGGNGSNTSPSAAAAAAASREGSAASSPFDQTANEVFAATSSSAMMAAHRRSPSLSPSSPAGLANSNNNNNNGSSTATNTPPPPPLPPATPLFRFGYRTSILAALSDDKSLQESFEGVDNFRDVGGVPAMVAATMCSSTDAGESGEEGGTRSPLSSSAASLVPAMVVKKHWLYRSASLVGMTRNDLTLLSDRLGIKTVIDLRHGSEVSDAVSDRKRYVEEENRKRSRVRLEIKKAEAIRRKRQAELGGGDDDDYDYDGDLSIDPNEPEFDHNGMRRRRRNKKNLKRPKMSQPAFSLGVDEPSDAELLDEEFNEGVNRDAELKPLEYVDHETHFSPISVSCKPGRVTVLESSDYEKFLASNKNSFGVISRAEWIRQRPVIFHVDFASRTIFQLASWWVLIVVLLLGLCFQTYWAARVIIKMTVERVGAAKYYRSLLVHQKEEIREVFNILADSANYPVLVCCQMGKDRTGILIALILSLLGVAPEDIVADYARTKTTSSSNAYADKIGLTSEEWRGAVPETMKTLLQSIEDEGGIGAYLNSIGVTDEVIQAVQVNLCVATS